MDTLFETLIEILKPNTTLYELHAIHLGKPIVYLNGFKRRIAPDDYVRIVDGNISDCSLANNFTHIVTSCRGMLNDTNFEISVMDLKTKDLSIIKL